VAYFALSGGWPVPSLIDCRMAEGWPGVQVYALEEVTGASRSGCTLAQSSARGLGRDYPMMYTATIAESRGASVSRKKAIPSSIA
jgi:hypothetical protein